MTDDSNSTMESCDSSRSFHRSISGSSLSERSPRLPTPCQATPRRTADLLRVFARVRPMRAECDGPESCVAVADKQQLGVTVPGTAVRATPTERSFRFDGVFGPTCGQQDLYASVGIPLLNDALQGYHTCLFAYGQTGSGKTWSLTGDSSDGGITGRLCHDLFARFVDMLEDNAQLSVRVTLTYYEVYNETVFDLLQPKHLGPDLRPLEVRQEGGGHRVTVVGLSEHIVLNEEAVTRLLRIGQRNRHVSNTRMNKSSSRSHAVLQLHIRQTVERTDSYERDLESSLAIVDLAGSERLAAEGSGQRMDESVQINRSLFVLGRSLRALADGRPHVPMRDSKLTRLLGQYFGGNARTVMLATVAPATSHLGETLGTLEFAQRAAVVQQCARVNRKERVIDAAGLQRQVEELQEQLKAQTMRYEQELLLKDMRIRQLEEASSAAPSPPTDVLESTAWQQYSQKLLAVHECLDVEEDLTAQPSTTSGGSTMLDESLEELRQLKALLEYRTECQAELYQRFVDVSESFRQVQVDLTHAADRAALQRRAYCLAWEHARRTLLGVVTGVDTILARFQGQAAQVAQAAAQLPAGPVRELLQHQAVASSEAAHALSRVVGDQRHLAASMAATLEQASQEVGAFV
eukprot:GGOE01019958.1.p1 GENE.GGOE01019958.1~~GGOE01019958.1.p1  ORF type:complete len:694 (+),score=144.15 GGOE01019958.1:182-2083(+)